MITYTQMVTEAALKGFSEYQIGTRIFMVETDKGVRFYLERKRVTQITFYRELYAQQ